MQQALETKEEEEKFEVDEEEEEDQEESGPTPISRLEGSGINATDVKKLKAGTDFCPILHFTSRSPAYMFFTATISSWLSCILWNQSPTRPEKLSPASRASEKSIS